MTRKEDTFKILVIPDLHDNPKESNRRFRWIARYATELQPNALIQLGDVADFDSLCKHVPNDSHRGKSKPTFEQDLVSLGEALQVFEDNLQIVRKDFVKHITLGNHEHRAWRFEDENPETFNTIANRITGLLEFHHWTWSPYGDYFNFKGVDFTHRPLNHMRQPIGAKTAARSVASDAHNDTVFGDTHKFYDCRITKIGTGSKTVRVVEAGCAMEWGKIKDYARGAKTGYWWGVVILTIHKGRIEGVQSVPMFELQKRFD